MAILDSTSDTITIQLTQGQVTVIDPDDADLASLNWHAHFSARYAGGGRYLASRAVRIGKNQQRQQLLHRVVLSRVLGRALSRGELVDHINGDPLDNRRSNLRLATPSQNTANGPKRKDNTSGHTGVYLDKRTGKWAAGIGNGGKYIHLGVFKCIEQAIAARREAQAIYHGEFAGKR